MSVAFNSNVDLTVEVGFGENLLTAPGSITWTDISAYVRDVPELARGRSHELDRFEAGTLSLILDNTDGRFNPANTSGAYYPDVVPSVPVRVVATYDSTDYPLFYGYVEEWPQAYPADGFDSVVTVTATDGFKVLNLDGFTSWKQTVEDLDPEFWFRFDAQKYTGKLEQDPGANNSTSIYLTAYESSQPTVGHFGRSDRYEQDYAFLFSGDDRTCSGAIVNSGKGSDTSVSWECWFSPVSDTVRSGGTLAQLYQSSDGMLQEITIVDNNATDYPGQIYVYTDGAGVLFDPADFNIDLFDGSYHHLIAVFDSNTVVVYLDGNAYSSESLTLNTSTGTNVGLYVAAAVNNYSSSYAAAFKGYLSELVWYRSALTASDAADLYNLGSGAISTSQTTTEAVGAILDYVGWPSGERTIATSDKTVGALELTTALAALQVCEATEVGEMFMGADGKIVFRDSLWRQKNNTSASETFSDASSNLPYSSVVVGYDDSNLYTDVIASNLYDGAVYRAEDGSLFSKYGRKTFSVSINTDSPEVAQATAEAYLEKYKTPAVRVQTLVVNPLRDESNLWDAVLNLEIGDRIRVIRTLTGDDIDTNVYVEKITHRFSPSNQWQVTLELSPVEPVSYWVLGTSELGSETYLGY